MDDPVTDADDAGQRDDDIEHELVCSEREASGGYAALGWTPAGAPGWAGLPVPHRARDRA